MTLFHRHITALGLAFRLILSLSSPVATAIPVSAMALQQTPQGYAQHEEAATGGGLFDPNAQLPFSRPEQGGDFDLQR